MHFHCKKHNLFYNHGILDLFMLYSLVRILFFCVKAHLVLINITYAQYLILISVVLTMHSRKIGLCCRSYYIKTNSHFLHQMPDISISVVFLLCSSQMFTFWPCSSPSGSVEGQKDLDTSCTMCWFCVFIFISSSQGTSVYYLCHSCV